MLISILITVLIVAVICWIISLLPMDARVKQVLYVVVALGLIIYLLRVLGVWVH